MSTINHEEVHKFSHNNWWDCNSLESQMLHRLNILRMEFVLSLISVKNKTILDIGCGGGIASESLSHCGGFVTGIDASKEAINCAIEHAQKSGVKIDYQNIPIENFTGNNFDIVFANDIIEHVENPALFLEKAGEKVKSSGIFIISTINKNFLATILAKFAAEYLFKLVPKGTHNEKKFINPSFIKQHLPSFMHIKTQGFSYNPLLKAFFFEPTALVNYFIVLQKK